MRSKKIPVSKTYPPLNMHANFNLDYVPAKGVTWIKPFTQKKFPKKMKDLNLPVTNEISLKKAFQINIPPYLSEKNISNLVKNLKKFVEIYKK